MTLHAPQPLPAQYRRRVGPLTRRIVEKRHFAPWQYRWERWGRMWGRLKAKMQGMRRYIGVAIAVIVLVGAVGTSGIVVLSSVFHVKEIRIRREDVRVDIESIERILAPFFGRHVFFVQPSEIQEVLVHAIPDIDRIVLIKEYPDRLIVEVLLQPFHARMLFSAEEANVSMGTGSVLQDFLTSNGVYVQYHGAYIPDVSGVPVIHIADWGIKPQPGRSMIEPHFLSLMQEAEGILRERFGQHVRARTLFIRAREFHMTVDQYTLWFDDQSSLVDQIGRYTLFLETVGGDAGNRYVDLRLRDKVVYH